MNSILHKKRDCNENIVERIIDGLSRIVFCEQIQGPASSQCMFAADSNCKIVKDPFASYGSMRKVMEEFGLRHVGVDTTEGFHVAALDLVQSLIKRRPRVVLRLPNHLGMHVVEVLQPLRPIAGAACKHRCGMYVSTGVACKHRCT